MKSELLKFNSAPLPPLKMHSSSRSRSRDRGPLLSFAEKSVKITLTFLLQLVILVIVANPVIISYKSAVLALRARQHVAARHCELRQDLEHRSLLTLCLKE